MIAIMGCSEGAPANPPTQQADTKTEEAPVEEPAATVVPTETPLPAATAVPTATVVPTETPLPTATQVPTATPRPTATRIPTAIPKPSVYEAFIERGEQFLRDSDEITDKINRNSALFRADRITEEEVCAGWREFDTLSKEYLTYLTDQFGDHVDEYSPDQLHNMLTWHDAVQEDYRNFRLDNSSLLGQCNIW